MTDATAIDAEIAAQVARPKELRRQRRELRLSEKAGRPYCQQPDSCVAGKRGGCSLCHGAKMSAARKAAWADPAVRAKMLAARKAAWADPAVRAKMLAARKAAWAGKRLPLSAEQKKVYTKLRAIVGKDVALAEAMRAPA